MSDTWTSQVVTEVWAASEDPAFTFTLAINPTITASGSFDGVHNDLDGRSSAGAHPASAVTAAGPFTGHLAGAGTVEAALGLLDDLDTAQGSRQIVAGAVAFPTTTWNPGSAVQPGEFTFLQAGTPFITYSAVVSGGSGFDVTLAIKRWIAGGVGESATLDRELGAGEADFGVLVIAASDLGGTNESPWARHWLTLDGVNYAGVPVGLNARQAAAVASALSSALAGYSPTGHTHDYSPTGHTHDDRYPLLTTTSSTVEITAASARTQIVGAADATSLLDGGSDTTLPNINLIGTSVAASSKHLARWDCPAPPSASHRLVGARVYGMAVDWGGWGETHVVATIFADGADEALAEPSSLNPADGLSSLGEVPHTIGGRGWYGQTPPAQFDLLLSSPVANVEAGDYQFVAGIVGWDEGGPPVLALPDSVSIDDVVWLWDVAPTQLASGAGHSAAVVSFADNLPGEVTLRLPADVGNAFAVTCDGSDGYQNRVVIETSAGAHLGSVWPGRTARFARPATSGTMQRIATSPDDPERYSTTAYLASVWGATKDCARIIGGADDDPYEITAHLGNDGILVFDNRAAPVAHELYLMGDYALSFGNEDNWPTDVTAVEVVAAGELVAFIWSDAELRYQRLSAASGEGGGGTVDVVSNVPTRTLVGRTATGTGTSANLAPNQAAALLGVDPGVPGTLSGTRGYTIPGRRISGLFTTITLVADRLYLLPVQFERDWSVSSLAFGVSTAVGGTTARIAMWAATDGLHGSGAPVIESGDISTAATGWKSYTPGSPVTGNAGTYLLGVCATGAITLRGALIPAADLDAATVAGGTNTPSVMHTLRRLNHTAGTAMPSSPTWDTVTLASGPTDLILAAQWSAQ